MLPLYLEQPYLTKTQLTKEIDVRISVGKSLTARAAEFAKRFRIKGLSKAPFSVRSILSGLDPVGWFNLTVRSRTVRSLRTSSILRLCAASRPLLSYKHGIRAWRYVGVYLKSLLSF